MKQHSSVEIVHLNILLSPLWSTHAVLLYFMVFLRRSDLIILNEFLKYCGDRGHVRVCSSISIKLVPS